MSGENIFTGIIDMNGYINDYRNRMKVGVDLQKEAEYINQIADMQELLERYFDLYGALQIGRAHV